LTDTIDFFIEFDFDAGFVGTYFNGLQLCGIFI